MAILSRSGGDIKVIGWFSLCVEIRSHIRSLTYTTSSHIKHTHHTLKSHRDISWIVPGKLAAFSGPLAQRKELASGKMTMIPEDYCPLFKQLGINCVVRFNNKCYDKRIFEVSLSLRLRVLFLYTSGALFHVECGIRQL